MGMEESLRYTIMTSPIQLHNLQKLHLLINIAMLGSEVQFYAKDAQQLPLQAQHLQVMWHSWQDHYTCSTHPY